MGPPGAASAQPREPTPIQAGVITVRSELLLGQTPLLELIRRALSPA